jgi:hypothetical protein
MFKITSFLLALALSQTVARQLSEELFHTYEPQTSVTDHVSPRTGTNKKMTLAIFLDRLLSNFCFARLAFSSAL